MLKKRIGAEAWLMMLLGDVCQSGQGILVTVDCKGYATICWSAFGQLVRFVHRRPDVDVFEGMTLTNDGKTVRIYLRRHNLREVCAQEAVRTGKDPQFTLYPKEPCTQMAEISVAELKQQLAKMFCIPDTCTLRLGKSSIHTFDRHLHGVVKVAKLDNDARKRFLKVQFLYRLRQCSRSSIHRWQAGDPLLAEAAAVSMARRFPDVAMAF